MVGLCVGLLVEWLPFVHKALSLILSTLRAQWDTCNPNTPDGQEECGLKTILDYTACTT